MAKEEVGLTIGSPDARGGLVHPTDLAFVGSMNPGHSDFLFLYISVNF